MKFEKYGFYKIDIDYLEFLHSRDKQVFYSDVEEYVKKPHLGILTQIGDMKYCIPLTSAKTKHLGWTNTSRHNLVIYEMVNSSSVRKKDICKRIGNTEIYKRILAVLEIGKMIPIKEGLYEYINFNDVENSFYRSLLKSEYRFLKLREQSILKKAVALYSKQKSTGIVEACYCDFEVLEKACNEYSQVLKWEKADNQTVETVALSILQRYAIAFEEMAKVS